MVAAQAVEDEARRSGLRGGVARAGLCYRFNAVLKRVCDDKSRAQMTLRAGNRDRLARAQPAGRALASAGGRSPLRLVSPQARRVEAAGGQERSAFSQRKSATARFERPDIGVITMQFPWPVRQEGTMHDTTEEAAALKRLARAHKEWRDRRPAAPAPPASDEEMKARIAEVVRKVRNPEPQDVAVLRAAHEDPLDAVIWSQLSLVGWRLYAKGGVDLLLSVYRRIELEEHPGFVYAVSRAWCRLGFPGDPRGTWRGTELL